MQNKEWKKRCIRNDEKKKKMNKTIANGAISNFIVSIVYDALDTYGACMKCFYFSVFFSFCVFFKSHSMAQYSVLDVHIIRVIFPVFDFIFFSFFKSWFVQRHI